MVKSEVVLNRRSAKLGFILYSSVYVIVIYIILSSIINYYPYYVVSFTVVMTLLSQLG